MFSHSTAIRHCRAPRRRAFSILEVLLVLGISALFIICIVGYFVSREVQPLKPPPRKPAAEQATPAPLKPEPAKAPPTPPAPAEPAPAAPAEPAP